MPSWPHLLLTLVLLAIIGFALVILSGFWHLIALLLAFAAFIAWLWRRGSLR